MKSKVFASLMVLCLSVSMFAQNKVTGNVKDNVGPAIGVSVIEQGTTNGTITDQDGNFTLTVKEGALLEISSIGYKTQVIAVGAQRQFNITLEEDAEFLDEVVVVGYGTQKKKLVTGSTVQVKGDELAKLNSTSALGAMQSSTPGMQITQTSGQPGEGYKVVIRGMGTTGSYSPLYVIDGVAGGDINALNPSDIESIDVLKDAASCAIYGARGANGVVLVTTKQGKEGKVTVTYDGFYGVQNVQKMPELLNAQQYMDIQDQVNFNMGKDPIDWQGTLSSDLYTKILDGSFTGTNWLEAIRNANAPTTNHAVNVIGGTDMSNFSLGVSYTSQEGIFGKPVASDYSRTTVRLNSDHVIWRKNGLNIITLGENMTYTATKKSGIGIGNHYWNDIYSMLSANPLVEMYDANGNYNEYDYLQNTGIWNLDSYVSNPVAAMYYSSRGNNESHGYSLSLSGNLKIQPIKNLIIKSQFNYSMSASTYRQYQMAYQLTNYAYSLNDVANQSGSAGWSWSWENTVNYKFNVADDHNFDVLVGNTLQHSGFGESAGGTASNGNWKNDWSHAFVDNMMDVDGQTATGSTWGDSGLVSFFGRINYDYKERYMLSLILRRDGSSNFMTGHRWGTFPSVSAGWIVTNEPWAQDIRGLDFFKIRGSWGQNGNCNVSSFQYLATVAVNDASGYSFGTGSGNHVSYSPGAYADKLANEDISWETSQQLDLGFDARFFKNRLNVAFDWYQKDTKDWLVNAPVMGHFGADAPYINGGDVRNSGVELALNWSDAVSQDFSYSIGVNGAFNKNEVTRIANEEGIIHGQTNVVQGIAELYRAQVGYPIGYFWTYKTDGVFQNQAEIDQWVAAGNPVMRTGGAVPGDLKFVDLNGDGVLDDNDKTMTGDPNPDFTAGINFSVYFKGFDFALSGYGQFGQQVFRAYRRYSDSQWNNYTTEVYDYWHGEGTSNKYPRLTAGTDINFMNNSDIFIEDASFFRIQTITFGYDFKRLWKSAPFEQCRLYVQAQNPFCFTNYKGMDPEVGSSSGFDSWASGIDLGYYPQAKTFLVGLNLKF